MNEANPVENVVNLNEAVIPLRVPHNIFDKIIKKAQFLGYPTVEAYCTAMVISTLTTKVGEALIFTTSQVSGTQTTKSHDNLIQD